MVRTPNSRKGGVAIPKGFSPYRIEEPEAACPGVGAAPNPASALGPQRYMSFRRAGTAVKASGVEFGR